MAARSGRRGANRVVAGVALSLMLLFGAGLLLRSLSPLLAVDRGFDAERVLVTTAQAWGCYPTGPLRTEFVRDAVDRLGAIPGVEAAGMTSSLPLSVPIGNERARIEIEGELLAPADEAPEVHVAAVSRGYADVVGLPPVTGRSLGPAAIAHSLPVAVVNREFARRLAVTTFLGAVVLWLATRRSPDRRVASRMNLVLAVAVLQLGLGIATLLLSVPFSLAVAHQGGAALLVVAAVLAWHASRPDPQRAGFDSGPALFRRR